VSRVSVSVRKDICAQAARFLAEYGFLTPPLPPDQALEARKLEVTQLNLDDLLVKANLAAQDHKKIQAMLDTEERAVTFRAGLPIQQRNWGCLHEIGHEFLPWQREILYFCPLLMLPIGVQKEFELEADIFAAEAFFFGERFPKYVAQGEWGLTTAIDLADNVFGTSLHSTFVHYVENSETPCCLLVWRPTGHKDELWTPSDHSMSLQYYVKSPSFEGHIRPGQIADPDCAVAKVFCESPNEVVEHAMKFTSNAGETLVTDAQSFSNSYLVFTLISQPRPIKQLAPVARRH
jgi:hypothetical protein